MSVIGISVIGLVTSNAEVYNRSRYTPNWKYASMGKSTVPESHNLGSTEPSGDAQREHLLFDRSYPTSLFPARTIESHDHNPPIRLKGSDRLYSLKPLKYHPDDVCN